MAASDISLLDAESGPLRVNVEELRPTPQGDLEIILQKRWVSPAPRDMASPLPRGCGPAGAAPGLLGGGQGSSWAPAALWAGPGQQGLEALGPFGAPCRGVGQEAATQSGPGVSVGRGLCGDDWAAAGLGPQGPGSFHHEPHLPPAWGSRGVEEFWAMMRPVFLETLCPKPHADRVRFELPHASGHQPARLWGSWLTLSAPLSTS